jgi:predicted HAD superfamily Cof-like phosphohydrolase
MSDASLVRTFTKETGNNVPNTPELMTKGEVFFLIKMMLDEIMELAATVETPSATKDSMVKLIWNSKDIPQEEGTEEDIIGAQADALVDCYYYSLNAAAKKGVNLSSVFKLVHDANMDKRIDGVFLKREDGKILKRPGWVSPDIAAEIVRQKECGSFN